ncbi:FTR1 family iron permease [Raoultella ornithinolytica]|uniref:FTR1 family iron permease n=1 Tax=Raoultella ornithinolytica TaxID=54291 RepID=UPI0013F48389|nr:FTR1 family protein [Raoultella ornithinolytica]ELS5401636.1 FTR1 family iron permease [Raoultella ornithinolytica]ELS5457122.1 FTR1 family iron permease [Raoultella ornithinolytica]ELS5477631.1 FTR1 family iron permease [Raoultella ornithinolytica]MDV1387590.1 FTR1 family protein [Raoultella ornithinolytica]MEB6460499.1 FTR1 family iron permease [Raoultella ornithinolytica]
MSAPRSFLLLTLLSVLFCACATAQTRYAPLIEDIEHRLDKTIELYQQQKNNEARREVQAAYFEVFENLEGPIRINFSARKSYEMESTFGDIRRMIADGKPLQEVQARVDGLKKALRDVEPVLDGGHRLVAEEQHTALTRGDIALHWQNSFRTIDDLLAQAVSTYQTGNYPLASQQVQQAHYQGFKNSEMEMSVRQNRSAKEAAAINQQFTALIALTSQPDRLNDVAYQVTTLLQELEDILPGLPTTRDDQPVNAPTADEGSTPLAAGSPAADWANVATGINQSIEAALTRYQHGEASDAILDIQDTYFDRFEASGMENKIGSRDAAFKTRLEAHFTRLVSLMKAGQPQDKLVAEAAALRADLHQAVAMLGEGEETQWSLLLYSLMIIVREGLEALLIVAAIVAWLVKNDHHDKLPLIRQSVIVALVASVATAVVFQLVFTRSGASRELLEGITMLIAVVMLFFMSYWLLSKVESRRWKAWLEGKLTHSLSRGSLVGLWLTSFLAVYREGAETVLFYYALVGDAQSVSGHLAIGAGFVIGCVLLLAAWLIMRYSVVRLPLKPFFIFTGGFMYLMAFVFAGKGVLELIEGKLFQPTLVGGVPEISWLGIYPYLETLTPQVILLIAALVALWITLRRNHLPTAQIKNNTSTN